MPKPNQKIRTYSALEVAKTCGVVNQTAINWIKSGHIKAFTTPGGQYRVYAEDLSDFLHARDMQIPDELQKIFAEQTAISFILIVDNDRSGNMSLRRDFETYDHDLTIYQAYTAFEAGRLAIEKKPNLIIFDLDLPGVDSLKICKALKTDQGFGSPILIATAATDKQALVADIMASGADAFFQKPVNINELTAKMVELAKAKRYNRLVSI